MNVHPADMLRQQQGMPHLTQNMLTGMGSQHFIPQQPPQGQQSQGQPQHMGLLQNNQNPNPPMGILGGAQPNSTGANLYQLQLQQANQQHRQVILQSQSVHGANPQRGVGQPTMNGLGHNQLQGMGFPNGMMPQQQLRRVASQPQPLNQAGAHIGGVQQGMGGIGGLSMNPPNGMPQQLRSVVQQQHSQQQQMNMRMQQQQQQQHQMQGMSPDMAMGMNRHPHMPVNGALPPHVVRTTSAQAQLMNNLGQQNGIPQAHPGGIQQPSMHQNAFNPMGLPHQHHQMSSSPHAGSQTHTPANLPASVPAPNSVSPQAVSRNRMTPDNNTMFMNFQNSQQNIAHNVPRLQPNNPQFPFVPSSTPPNQVGDMSQSIGAGQIPASGSGTRMTPAQVFEHMTQGGDNYPPQFNMAQSNASPRPPSHNGPHAGFPMQPAQQHRQSPHQPEHMHMSQVQRPQSQPQGQQRQSPQQQPGASRTPRVSQPPLPLNAGMQTGRIPPMSGPHPSGPPQQPAQPPPPAAAGHQLQIAPRQQAGPNASTAAGAAGHQDGAPPAQHPAAVPAPGRGVPNTTFLVGLGQGISRLMAFSLELSHPSNAKMQLSFWEKFVENFYTPNSVLKITLWKDNERNEAKPFEIGVPILPRFFLVTTQSGVKTMSLHLEGARERLTPTGHGLVECVTGQWTFRYTNGYSITLRGPFSAHVVVVPNAPGAPGTTGQYSLKFEHMQFDAVVHEKLIHVNSITGLRTESTPMTPGMNGFEPAYEEPKIYYDRASIPSEPVNAFGIPQATMRCLELAESVAQMSDLIQFSTERSLGPMDALAGFAAKLRFAQQKQQQSHPSHPQPPPPLGSGHGQNPKQSPMPNPKAHPSSLSDGAGNNANTNTNTSSTGSSFAGANGVGPSVSHYPGAPSTSAGPSQGHPPPSTPQNQPAVIDKSQKAPAAPSSQASGSTPASASTPAAGTPGGPSTTPSMAPAPLKRKAPGARPDTNSPTMANAEQAPPAKRVTRKRGRTQGG